MPLYEVSKIKPHESSDKGLWFSFTQDGLTITNASLITILHSAFGLQDDRILGAPVWTKSKHYDLEAKVRPEDVPDLEKLTDDQRRMMLCPLLKERFGMKFHHEQRSLPVFALIVAPGGSKLRQTEPNPHTSDGEPLPHILRTGAGNFNSEGSPVAFLVDTLSKQLDRTILDETGLTGYYDYTLQWTPDDAAPPVSKVQPDAFGGSPSGEGGPSLFTALEEQLGLRLLSQKSKVDVIVIDSISPPSPN